ncbi:MAG: GDSL-type esterase/lipase family protein [Alphaproteobacteria bacterium]|nr:GDSL-type esterase/lipase family protein [Alphaproteobacteria bacterium]
MTVVRICFLGDSVTVGTGDAGCRGWPSYLSAEETTRRGHDISCYNLGIRAETSLDIARRWRAEVGPRLPDHVAGRLVFMFGLNDCADFNGDGVRVPHDESVAAARTMIGEAAAWKPTLWIGMTPVRRSPPSIQPGPGVRYTFDRERTAALNLAYRETAADLGVPYVDLHDMLAEDSDWDAGMDAGDGVHPDDAGHQRIARIVADSPAWRAWFQD